MGSLSGRDVRSTMYYLTAIMVVSMGVPSEAIGRQDVAFPEVLESLISIANYGWDTGQIWASAFLEIKLRKMVKKNSGVQQCS